MPRKSPGTVYANAFDPNFQQLTPSATITFELDGTPCQALWRGQHGHVVRNELRGISVFDGDCARHYLQTRETATFQPVALTHLQQLAHGLNQALRPRIQAEIAGLTIDITLFNVIPADTDAGRAVHPISATTDVVRARALAALSRDEQSELSGLPQEISEADPTAKATLLENAASRVDELAHAIATAASAVSDDAIDMAQSAHRRLLDAEEAERAASALLQEGDATTLLPGTGQGHWALLFNAAREYSTAAAYPQQAFPVVDEGAHCVLCQQELGPAAKTRLQRFDRFVKDSASEVAQAARNAWQQIMRDVGQATVTFALSQVMSDSLRGRAETLPRDIQVFQEDMLSRLHWLRAAMVKGEWQGRPAYRSADPSASVRQIADNLRTEANALRANLDAETLAAKRLRLRELGARRQLSEHIDSIARVVGNLRYKAKLHQCLEDIGNTRPITLLAGQLAKTYVSEALAERMNDELRKLDLYHIRVGVSSTGDAGSVRLGVFLTDSRLDLPLVLSEAEQRMCSLAYFLAELHQSKSSSGIVFDDPVSSLDHSHRTAVARRIVEESTVRQVIVFTHDAVFFGELTTLCGDAGVAPCVKSISYRAEGPGYIDAGIPYDMRKHSDRIAQHRVDHQRIAADFNNPPGDLERLTIRNAYDDLRVTIEVGIEETILNGTVVRFRDNISVGRLDGVMIVEAAEYREVQRLHDKCCRNVRAHSHAAGQQRAVTQPTELLQDIEAVNVLFREIRKRRG
ncbi:MAG: AAA family ATPase [Rhodanobacteraceae bacterium]|nr:AAA family ATPase [Rhodanobacteraceae bacterium]